MKLIAILVSILVLFGCSSGEKKDNKSAEAGPKTGYGQAVQKANDLAKASEERAKKIDKDLEEAEDEEGE